MRYFDGINKTKFLLISYLALISNQVLFLFDEPKKGLDNSWRIGLELVKKANLTFGTEVIFTYGPLGSLTQRYQISTSKIAFYSYDISMLLLFVYCVHLFISSKIKAINALIIGILYTIFIQLPGEWHHYFLLYFAIFLGFKFLKTYSYFDFCLSLCLFVFLFFCKINYGLFGVVFIPFFTIYAIYSDKSKTKHILTCIIFAVIAFVFLTYKLNVNVPAYFKNSLEIINSYNGTSKFPYHFKRILVSSFILFFVLFFWFLIKAIVEFKNKQADLIFSISLILSGLLLSFISLKYSVVRADTGHLWAMPKYFIFGPLLYVHFKNYKARFREIILLFLFSFSIYLIIYQKSYEKFNFNLVNTFNFSVNKLIFYQKQFIEDRHFVIEKTIPKNISNIIKKESVDILNLEISEAYFNDLYYTPRPIFQSYLVNTKKLDQLNANFFTKTTRPTFILHALDSTIDGKSCFNIEPLTKLTIKKNYRPIYKWNKFILLKREPVTTPLKFDTCHTETGLFSKAIPLSSSCGQNKFYKIYIDYTFLGFLYKTLFQEPSLTLELENQNKKTWHFETSKMNLEMGLIMAVPTKSCIFEFYQDRKNTQIPAKFKLVLPFRFMKYLYKPSFRIESIKPT